MIKDKHRISIFVDFCYLHDRITEKGKISFFRILM